MRDLLGIVVGGDDLALDRHVDAVDARADDRRRRGDKIDFGGAAFAQQLHDVFRGRTAHDGIVHHRHLLAAHHVFEGIELLPHDLLAPRLGRHDEAAAHVVVLRQPAPVRHAQRLRHPRREEIGRRRHVDHQVRLQPSLFHLLRQLPADAHALGRHQPALDHRILAGEVDVFKNAERLLFRPADAAMHLAFVVDQHGFAGLQIAHGLETEVVEAVGLRRERVDHPAVGVLAPQHQRPDAVRIREGQQPVPGDDRQRRIRALHLLLHRPHRIEDVRGRERLEVLGFERGGQGVEDQGHVVRRVQQAVAVLAQRLLELLEIDDVAVVDHRQAEGIHHHRRLGVQHVGRALRGVAHVPQTDFARKTRQVDLLEGLPHQPVRLVQVEAVVESDDAGGVLAAVLDAGHAFQQRPGDVVVPDDS